MRFGIAASIVAASVGLMGAAQAADWSGGLAPARVSEHNWTGFYIGGHLGYGIDKQRATSSASVTPSFLGLLFEPGAIAEQRDSAQQSRFRSVLGGVQVGYNYQYGRFVFGAEGDVTFGNLKAGAASSSVQNLSGTLNAIGAAELNMNPGDVISTSSGSTFSARHRLGTFGTLRGRVGYAFDRYLVYLTGGVAFADMQTSATFTNFITASPNIIAANPIFAVILAAGNNTSSTKTSRFAVGGSFGGGVEVALTANWSVKAEYLYLALPNQNVFLGGNFRSFSNTFHVARAGLNYRF
ncbi:MAG: porin family protein [Rhizobiales bacterium]|nr:porin family protein [Hyphomicrobiales bacterium]